MVLLVHPPCRLQVQVGHFKGPGRGRMQTGLRCLGSSDSGRAQMSRQSSLTQAHVDMAGDWESLARTTGRGTVGRPSNRYRAPRSHPLTLSVGPGPNPKESIHGLESDAGKGPGPCSQHRLRQGGHSLDGARQMKSYKVKERTSAENLAPSTTVHNEL